MKTLKLLALFALVLVCLACGQENESEVLGEAYAYSVSVELMTDKTNAPALQSFAHGVNGSKWLFFAGRTNQDLDDGGMHDLNGNYASTSFVPWSFNENILVYDFAQDELVGGMPFADMVGKIENIKKGTGLVAKLKEYETVFRNSNPLVTQEGDYVYLVGGYGTPIDSTQSSSAYQTFGQVARIHVPSVISLVTEANPTSIDWDNIFAFGENDTLKSTGAEVFKIGATFYAAGGHNFGGSAPQPEGQKYLDAVYPFTLTKTDSFSLDVGIKTAISDIKPEDIGKQSSDNVSKFRRRDGPVVPALFNNNGAISQGLTFYGGVFQPDSVVEENGKKVTYFNAWNTAIYVHPGYSSANPSPESPYYTIDPSFYQANTNVYACSDFELYDASNGGHVITYLIGGIGDGTRQSPGTLSPFTNSLMEIHFNMTTGNSKKHVDATNVFDTDYFYGAESTLIPNNDGSVKYFSLNGEPTELVDGAATFPNASGAVTVGYVYGGIEAFTATPGTYGPTKSAASNKVWKVTLNKVGL